MKWILPLLLSVLGLRAATIEGDLRDISNAPYRANAIQFFPTTGPVGSGTATIIGQPKSIATPGGLFSLTLISGWYDVRFPPSTNVMTIFVPNTNGTLNLNAVATNLVQVVTNYFATPYTFTNGVTRYVALTGSVARVTAGVRELPYPHITNAIAAMSAGDTLVILDSGPYVFTNCYSLPKNVQIFGNNAILTNGFPRPVADNQDLTMQGAMLVPSDNCIIQDLTIASLGDAVSGWPLIKSPPPIGILYFDKSANAAQQLPFTNALIRNLRVIGSPGNIWGGGWYIRATNGCTGRLINCTFYNRGSICGFSSFGPHNFVYENCTFINDGPDPIPGDSGVSSSIAFKALSGTNTFYGCSFDARNPTNYIANNSPTGAVAFAIDVGEGWFPQAEFFGCRFKSVNTNATINTFAFDIANGQDGSFSLEFSPMLVHGGGFDRSKVRGPVTEESIPMTGGIVTQNDTNRIVFNLLTGSDNNQLAVGQWSRDSSQAGIKYTNVDTGGGSFYLTNDTATLWRVYDPFDSDTGLTNRHTTFTNGTFTGGPSDPTYSVRYVLGAITNTFLVWPPHNPLTANGSGITNLPLSGIAGGSSFTNSMTRTNDSRPQVLNLAGSTNLIRPFFTGGGSFTLSGASAATNFLYCGPNATSTTLADSTNKACIVPIAGTLCNLYASLSVAVATGTNIAVTVFTNGVASSIVANITSATAAGSFTNDTTHTEFVQAGTKVVVGFTINNSLGGVATFYGASLCIK